MSTIDWPATLIPQTARLALRKSGQLSASPFNGSTQAWDFASERWVLSVTLPELASRQPRGVESFLNFMAGGINRVRGWHFGKRGMVAGTLRGSVTMGATAAVGATSITLAGVTGRNMLLGPGFEVDTNTDGLADHWSSYMAGTESATPSHTTDALEGTHAQRFNIVSLGATTGDNVGAVTTAYVAVAPNTPYTFSAYVYINTVDVSARIYVGWYTSANSFISDATTVAASVSAWQRLTLTATAPTNAAKALMYIWAEANTGGATNFTLDIDNAQMEIGTSASAFVAFSTLLADDLLGLPTGQLVQAAADCASSDGGAMVVPITGHVRTAATIGGAVVWNKPTADFVMPALEAGAVWQPGRIERAALDLVEVW